MGKFCRALYWFTERVNKEKPKTSTQSHGTLGHLYTMLSLITLFIPKNIFVANKQTPYEYQFDTQGDISNIGHTPIFRSFTNEMMGDQI